MTKAIAITLVILFSAPAADAAIVYLKDGSQVRGTVVSATARDLKVHTPDGDLNIAADRILRVDYTEQEFRPAETTPDENRAGPRRSLTDDQGRARQMMSFGFGLATPLTRVDFSSTGGGSADNGETGFLLGVQYHYFLTSKLAAGFDVEYLNRGVESTQNLVPFANTDIDGSSTLLMATLRYSLIDRGGARPYLMAGLGANRTSMIALATPIDGFAWSDTSTAETRKLADHSRWGLAGTLRFGIDFMLADPALFSLEFGWTGISNSDYSTTAAGKDLGLESITGDLGIMTVAARWGWRF